MKISYFIVHNTKYGVAKLQVIITNAINLEPIDDMGVLWKAGNSSSWWVLKLSGSREVGAAASPKRFSHCTPDQLGWKAEFSLY